MPIAVALIVLVVASLLFHFLSPWTFTPIASNWGMIDLTVDITFVVTGIVFVAVNLFMAYAIIRYRHREGARANYEPENKKLEFWLTVGTTIGVAAMLIPGLFVWAQFVKGVAVHSPLLVLAFAVYAHRNLGNSSPLWGGGLTPANGPAERMRRTSQGRMTNDSIHPALVAR